MPRNPSPAALLWTACLAASLGASSHVFARDHILGTSLDLCVQGTRPRAAAAFEAAALCEIERLRGILSTYDPTSEVSRLRPGISTAVSLELFELLGLYDHWQQATRGALGANAQPLRCLWRQAAASGQLPSPRAIAQAAEQARRPAWKLDAARCAVTLLCDGPLNLDALGKGYIIDRAFAFAARQVPQVQRAILNIGGDLRCLGEWDVAVADPRHPADTAAPLTCLRLRDVAVATSGGDARALRVGRGLVSHLLDLRSGLPAPVMLQAAVVATDAVSANALSTALCVLPRQEARVMSAAAGAASLLVQPGGEADASPAWLQLAATTPDGLRPATRPATRPVTRPASRPVAKSNWPAGMQVQLTLTVADGGGKRHRPFVTVWVEDSQRKLVRTLAVWGNERKYWRDLPDWFRASNRGAGAAAVSRPTRPPGEYRLEWDGRDSSGAFVPAGRYTLKAEAAREKGGHETLSVTLDCSAQSDQDEATGERELAGLKASLGKAQP